MPKTDLLHLSGGWRGGAKDWSITPFRGGGGAEQSTQSTPTHACLPHSLPSTNTHTPQTTPTRPQHSIPHSPLLTPKHPYPTSCPSTGGSRVIMCGALTDSTASLCWCYVCVKRQPLPHSEYCTECDHQLLSADSDFLSNYL